MRRVVESLKLALRYPVERHAHHGEKLITACSQNRPQGRAEVYFLERPQHRVIDREQGDQNPGERSSRDQTRREQTTGAQILSVPCGRPSTLAIDDPFDEAAKEDRQGGRQWQISAYREGERGSPAQLDRDCEKDTNQHELPIQVVSQQASDQRCHQRTLRRRILLSDRVLDDAGGGVDDRIVQYLDR